MRFSINLRGDLAKLGDVELVERLEAAWQAYETAPKPSWLDWKLLWRWRGPFRHPRFYRFLSVLSKTAPEGGWFAFLFAAWAFSSKGAEPPARNDPAIDVHLILCEIRDLTDEMERRVAYRRRQPV
jgi:hypothetical protein